MEPERLRKIELMQQKGLRPYGDRFPVTHSLGALAVCADETAMACAGRVISIRDFGKLLFVTLGNAVEQGQISLGVADLGAEALALFKETVDIGDFVGVRGVRYCTRRGEPTVRVQEWQMLSKTLRSLPEKFHGLQDETLKVKQRYLDTMSNPRVASVFVQRAKLKRFLRNYLDGHGFLEVDTPALQGQKSGALAKPFVTHHNALDMDVALRIAPETYLKRAVVGGFERVYEIALCFRNEGVSQAHWPEFHMLEFYAAYWNWSDLLRFTETMIKQMVLELTGGHTVTYQGTTIDFSGDWPQVTFRDLILEKTGLDILLYPTGDGLKEEIRQRGLLEEGVMAHLGRGSVIDHLYKRHARPTLIHPTFLIAHPTDISPLARQNDDNPLVVDRFQLVVHGWEVVNAYSELADPQLQRLRFEEQAAAARGGDQDALEVDDDFLLALEHGLPPTAGWGMGLERFLALLTDCPNIKDTILFPLTR